MILEICTPTIQSAINAQNGGANRIELCANLREGGTTPSAATILACKKYLTIPTFVLIRERGGDFCYNDLEMEVMINDIIFCRENGIDGVVIGALHNDKTIHIEQIKAMIAAAGNMQITFHRAFDNVKNPYKAFDILKALNINRLLTSGLQNTALEGIDVLKKLVQMSENEIIVMPGSGVTPQNMEQIIRETNCEEIHFSAKKTIISDGFEHWESDEKLVKEAVGILNPKF